ncbi:MAG: lipooligosaccharide transport system permease protein [Gaiellales bacterium]|nr:lipooligosaccharide transport system permease protein [Gaiellales bacterium]
MQLWRAFGYWMTQYRKTWRGTIVISVANPLLFLAGIGAGLGDLVDRHAPEQLGSASYLAFFAPGLLAASAMQTGFIEGSGRVSMAAGWAGSYRSAATTPLEPSEIMGGHLLFIAFRVLSSSAAFVAVMAVFGVSDGCWALAVLPAALLTGLAFAAPAAAWAVGVRFPRQINTVFRFVIMPMYMFSGTFFASGQLPGWLRPVVEALPLWQGVELCRTLSLGSAGALSAAFHAGYLLVLTAGGILAARVTYRRRLHS